MALDADSNGGEDDPVERGRARRRRSAVATGLLSGLLAVLFVLVATYAAGSGARRATSPPGSVRDDPLDLTDVADLLGAESATEPSPTTAPPPGDYSPLCRLVASEVAAWDGLPNVADLVRLLDRADLSRWAGVAPPGLRPTLIDLQRAVAQASPVLAAVAATGQITRSQVDELPSALVTSATRLIQVWMARCAGA